MADPYEVLGVQRSADAETIKRAYRKLAKQFHPDLNPGETKHETRFKEITAAYDLLSDPDKRARYDRGEIDASGTERPTGRFYRGYANAGAGGRSGFSTFGGGFDTDDIFEMFAQGSKRGGTGGFTGKRRGTDISYSVSIDFLASINGAKRRLTLPDGRALDVTIPPGSEQGTVLRLKGQGQPGLGGGPAGDAFIEVQVEPHAFFRREGADIHVDVPVTLPEAVLGGSIPVPTVEGLVSLKVPRGSNTGTVLRMRGRGAPGKTGKGDQYVRLVVQLPDNPDPDLAAFLEKWAPNHSYRVRGKLGIEN